jgi:hypothetical protein
MAKKEEKKIKEFKVKVPVYATKIVEGSFTYNVVIDGIKKALDNYNMRGDGDSGSFIAFNKSNKTQRKVIQKVDFFDYNLGEEPCCVPTLLLKTTTYTTNIHDAYTVDTDDTIRVFDNATKLGNEHNYMLFYPNFVGYEPNQKANWLIFICGNSNKQDTEIIETAKLVISRVLKLDFVHITPKEIMEKIQTSIPLLKIKLIGIERDVSDAEEKFPTLLIDTKLKREKNKTYKEVSFDNVQELLDEDFDSNEYQIREVTFEYGKKCFKIVKKFLGLKVSENEYDELGNILEEAQQIFQIIAEQTFTDSFTILETEDKEKRLHEHNFIIDKITPIISNYIASYNG